MKEKRNAKKKKFITIRIEDFYQVYNELDKNQCILVPYLKQYEKDSERKM
mgnify:CR=1 FL=1